MPLVKRVKLPWWRWIVAFLVIQSGSLITINLLYTPGVADVYIPLALGIVLVYWWGPGMLVVIYLNTFINSVYWGHADIFTYPFFGLPETLFAFLSWLFFVKLNKGKFWLPDLSNLLRFLLLGIVFPLSIYEIFIKNLLIYYGELDQSLLGKELITSWVGDFMATMVISMLLLFFLTNLMNRKKLLVQQDLEIEESKMEVLKEYYPDIIIVFFLVVIFSFQIDFSRFWYLYALIGLVVSIKDGFGVAILVNLFIFLLTYVLPAAFVKQPETVYFSSEDLVNIYLGNTLLSIFSIVSGRVISDYRHAVFLVEEHAQKIQQVNEELDRFVYSVSHDLISPLKSIKGLTNIMRLEDKSAKSAKYINMLEGSALRMEVFINEILDYSRNSRTEIVLSEVKLADVVDEVLENCRFSEGFGKIEFHLEGMRHEPIPADIFRLKIILNNLISNAIKFVVEKEKPVIRIYTSTTDQYIVVTVEDNGPGIELQYQQKIFDMFYRANVKRPGSGLGLYIAKEAARAMGASLAVESEPGKGSKFILELPNLSAGQL